MNEDMPTIGRVRVRRWPAADPARLVVLVHGYGEHIGRYEHVAQALVARGSAVVGPDHVGHGRSDGERALVKDFEPIVDDLRAVVEDARGDLPVVMVGHSMGGLIAARYAQRHRDDLAGPDTEWHVLNGARHEVFNELDQDETIGLVASFAERVTAR